MTEREIAALRALLDAAKAVRDSAGYFKPGRRHYVSASVWEGFCKQIAIADHACEKANQRASS